MGSTINVQVIIMHGFGKISCMANFHFVSMCISLNKEGQECLIFVKFWRINASAGISAVISYNCSCLAICL